MDVPAAVLCALCGSSECGGCAAPSMRAGTITPWEQPDRPVWRRLLETARATTLDAEVFFGALGEGSLAAAFRFAFACELCAIASLAVVWAGVATALVPELGSLIVSDVAERGPILLGLGGAIPALAVLMVGLHVLWAGGLEVGIRRAGAAPRGAHCLRYALYSCGWDLVTSPAGFLAGWASGGIAAAGRELRAAIQVPRSATEAYLTRARQLPAEGARRALLTALWTTGVIVVLGAIGLATVLVLALTEIV